MASKKEWKTAYLAAQLELQGVYVDKQIAEAAALRATRRIAWIYNQVQQWHDNESTKSLPPMRRDQAEGQIRKSAIRQEAYGLVLMMFDAPVPATFGREDEAEDDDDWLMENQPEWRS